MVFLTPLLNQPCSLAKMLTLQSALCWDIPWCSCCLVSPTYKSEHSSVHCGISPILRAPLRCLISLAFTSVLLGTFYALCCRALMTPSLCVVVVKHQILICVGWFSVNFYL
ncbi:hypothetical protein GDO86_011715 [Hymenochirus boettgeri]|uniref:Uncharacterized protein n=1 Tax=Hymenochirus boettgeri TaxID=247094 RepID=A0A8T2JI47_9PIPI|nr:hypothetical protein GDO86_011715 [Hymenochirus boettgeri]